MMIRTTTEADAQALRELRLTALRLCPEAFGSHHDEEIDRPAEHWVQRATPTSLGVVFIAEDDGRLVGMAGMSADGRRKTGHTAHLWGVFVRPEARGGGTGARLVAACLGWARERAFAQVKLCVVADNDIAIRCYGRIGFTVYGVDPDVLRVDGRRYDELLMVCRLG